MIFAFTLIALLGLLAFATLPTLMFAQNLQCFLPPQEAPIDIDATGKPSWRDRPSNARPAVSLLFPARNEAAGIGKTLEFVRQLNYPELEVIVLDDHSEDGTAAIVREAQQLDPRIRLETSQPLPEGWNGKQFACWQLSQLARHELLLFVDADVHLAPDSIAKLAAEMELRGVDLLSGFPRQVTETWSEKLLIPMMYVVLLGYLPIDQMRRSTDPRFAAGCGQLFLARKSSYFKCGGHQAIQGSRHDGIKLPRNFRNHQLKTDLLDATELASCRMYHNLNEVVRGLLKNATEGIANARLIGPFTLLLGGAFIAPAVALIAAIALEAPLWILLMTGIATLLSFVPRLLTAIKFRQSWLGVVLHPVSMVWFLALQWIALVRSMQGKQVAWRGRI